MDINMKFAGLLLLIGFGPIIALELYSAYLDHIN